jgi:hypothetical protein
MDVTFTASRYRHALLPSQQYANWKSLVHQQLISLYQHLTKELLTSHVTVRAIMLGELALNTPGLSDSYRKQLHLSSLPQTKAKRIELSELPAMLYLNGCQNDQELNQVAMIARCRHLLECERWLHKHNQHLRI